MRTEGIWIWVGMKDCEWNWSMDSVCRREFVQEGELVGYEELVRLLQRTYSKRHTFLNGMMNCEIGSVFGKWCSGKKPLVAVRNVRNKR